MYSSKKFIKHTVVGTPECYDLFDYNNTCLTVVAVLATATKLPYFSENGLDLVSIFSRETTCSLDFYSQSFLDRFANHLCPR